MAMLLMFSTALPVLLSEADCDAVVVPLVAVKLSEDGVSVAMGAAAATPVPVSDVDCVAGVALSVTTNEAAKLLADAGVNVT
jgi:hypothetical protein